MKEKELFDYKVVENEGSKSITIDGLGFLVNSEITDLVIPSEIDGIPVTCIADCAFERIETLLSVTIPDSVVDLRESVFAECVNLESVKISNNSNLICVGPGAFYGCSSLTNIVLPNGIMYICCGAFQHCASLRTINIPDGTLSIDDFAFENCTKLSNVIIPDSVIYLEV